MKRICQWSIWIMAKQRNSPSIFAASIQRHRDTYELILVPWNRACMNPWMARRHYQFFLLKERAILYDFSEPIYDDDLQLVVLKGHEFVFKKSSTWREKPLVEMLRSVCGDLIKPLLMSVFVMERDRLKFPDCWNYSMEEWMSPLWRVAWKHWSLLASTAELKANSSKFVVLPSHWFRSLHLAFLKTMNMNLYCALQ